MPDQSDELSALYEGRKQRFEQQASQLSARSRSISNLRGLAFGTSVVALMFALFGSAGAAGYAISALAALGFIALVIVHKHVIDAEDDARRWGRVNRDALARVTGEWHKLTEDGSSFRDNDRGYSDDLDIFGKNSVFQRLCVAHTRFGQQRLAQALGNPASLQIIAARQQAIRELAQKLELRQHFEALALAIVDPTASKAKQRGAPDPEPLLAWASGPTRLVSNPLWKWLSISLPTLTAALVAMTIWRGWPSALWTLPLFSQLAVLVVTREQSNRVFTAASSTEGAFLRYGAMLQLFEAAPLQAQLLQKLKGDLLQSKPSPSQAMKEFRRIVGWFDLRHNGLVYPFVNLALLWDVHCVLSLERWQLRYGRAARSWFEALGELEMLCSFAGLCHDEPGFCFPEISRGESLFEAEALGHPLIAPRQRVTNDVPKLTPGKALLVTGSNMSGKSTFLRSLGLAAVLAQAGAPVCASRLRMSRLKVSTSVQVRDSLSQGVSHFYAELNKLKAIVDSAKGGGVLFLLDEILHGTNSRERQIGARWLLTELLSKNTIGAVSTHDMELCRLPDALMQNVKLVHFRENELNGRMTFDYKLREGPVTAGNALRLMRSVGLDVPLDEHQTGRSLD